VLGSQILENQTRVAETATAIILRQAGENSVLANIATSVSESLTQVLRWAYWWNSTEVLPECVTDEHVLVELNTDFSMKGMTSQDLQAVVAAWQAGAISQDTMLQLFRKGEILPDGRTNREEEALIRMQNVEGRMQNPPSPGSGATGGAKGSNGTNGGQTNGAQGTERPSSGG
jgi:hypothetical protein